MQHYPSVKNPSLTKSRSDWRVLPDDELLKVRICDLDVQIKGTRLESGIERLYRELDRRHISFHPPCYLADEWFCPDGDPIIGIPFYLAHPRLCALERRMMLEAEGSTDEWCMQLLRHETGHAINYAYLLHRRHGWKQHFGVFESQYPSKSPKKPYSRSFVAHLANNYAQSHPDEDFAETFAVWLTPESKWRERYRGWPAMKKLNFVNKVMSDIKGRQPKIKACETPWSAARMRSTLGEYYDKKRRVLRHEYPGFYDAYLKRLYSEIPASLNAEPAVLFLRRLRRQMVNSVALWTGHRKFDIDKTIKILISRCHHLGLYVDKKEPECIAETAAFLTAIMGNIHGFRRGFECQCDASLT